MIEALKYCVEKNIMEVDIYLDSLLVVQQVNLEYKVKSKKLQEHYNQALDLINKINNVKITHVRREFSKRADQLANQALDEL